MGFKPDYGLKLVREGISSAVDLFFYDFNLFHLTILTRSCYSTVVDTPYDGVLHALSLDFDLYQLEQILSKADPREAALLRAELSRDPLSPRSIDLERRVAFGLRARLGSLQKAEKEQFVPLIAQEILSI
jgi:hypothetical protein